MENIKLTLRRGKEKLSLEFDDETNSDDMKYIFSSILSWLSFGQETIKEFFNEE